MYHCECGRIFEKLSSLNSHARFCKQYVKKKSKTLYKIDEIYVCECGKEFAKSQSINSHFSHCIVHRDGKPPISQRGGGGWSKGKTKESDEGVAKMAKSLSENTKGKIGKAHSVESKRKISEARIYFLEHHPNNNIVWYEVNNGEKLIKVQGKWEKDVAEWLTNNKIRWSRIRIAYDSYRTYTPDFWLPDYKFFIEVKGWMRERDLLKMKKVVEEKHIDIRLLDKELYSKLPNLNLNDLKTNWNN